MEITTQSRVTGQGQRVIKTSGCDGGVRQREMCWDGGQSAIYKSIHSTSESNSEVGEKGVICVTLHRRHNLRHKKHNFPNDSITPQFNLQRSHKQKKKTLQNSLYQCLAKNKTLYPVSELPKNKSHFIL